MPSSDPTHEVRLGVVMYGGVSLAVYMSGVARELFNVVHASRAAADGRGAGGAAPASQPDAPAPPATDIAAVYREVIAEMDADLGARSRVSVDVIVGASAGGINGVYLAKALAAGAHPSAFDSLRRLWFEQAGIASLVEGLGPRSRVRSLFDGAFMYERLREALEAVDEAASGAAGGPRAEQLSLVVTATDLAGVPVRMRLADRVAEERDHKHAFEFRRDERGRDDFDRSSNALLAFAARTTSSFPVAFEPTRVQDFAEHDQTSDDRAWWRLFRGLRDPRAPSHRQRVYSDGGYLDNKPFGHAIDQLAATSPGTRVTRKLLYVEPNPELDVRSAVKEPPDAIANAASAFTLARYETIRDDLARLTERNRLIHRIRTLTAGLEEDVARLGRQLDPVGRSRRYAASGVVDLVRRSGLGPSYGAYHRLRVATTTDRLADLVADAVGVPEESDHRLAIRQLMQQRRAHGYERNPAPAGAAEEKLSESAFLQRYDARFRLRRARFVLAKLDALAHLTRETVSMLEHYRSMSGFSEIEAVLRRFGAGADDDDAAAARAAWAPVAEALAGPRESFQAALDRLQERLSSGTDGARSLAAALDQRGIPGLDRLSTAGGADELEAELDATLRAQATGDDDSASARSPSLLASLAGAVEEAVRDEVSAFDLAFDTATLSLTRYGDDPLIEQVGLLARVFYSEGFELYDAIEFPLVEAAGLVGERAPVDVYRVSPADATLLFEAAGQSDLATNGASERARNGKLFGSRVGSFGAFFDRRWRENDMLWGRLDGAERVIASLLPGPEHCGPRRALTLKAARAIVLEELPQLGAARVASLDGPGLLAAIYREHPREQAPAATSVVQDVARVARTGTALLRELQPSMTGTNAALRLLGALLLLLLWAFKAHPLAFAALGLTALAVAFGVAYWAQLTLLALFASAVSLAALLGAALLALSWVGRRRLLAWLKAQLGSRAR